VVIWEKPMSDSMKNAKRMHRTSERTGKMLMLHQQLPWLPIYTHLRQMVAKGTLGELSQMEFDMYVFSDACLVGYRSRLPQLMLQDLAIHHFDLMRYVTGKECERLYVRSWKSNEAWKKVPATTSVFAVLDLEGGLKVCYRSKMRELLDPTGYLGRIEITGSKGAATAFNDTIRMRAFKDSASKKPPREIAPAPVKKNIWQAFADAIKSRKPMWTSSGNNLKSLEMLFAAVRSAETGKIVEL